MKKIICILMSLMIFTLSGCGKKDDDIPVIQNETANQLEIPGVPAPEPEPVVTYEDYFPQVALLGLSLQDVTQEYVEDEFEEEILRYVLEGVEVCDILYDKVSLFTDDNDTIIKVTYDFVYGDKYGDATDIQIQDSVANLESIYETFISVDAIDVAGEYGNLLDVVDDYNSAKILSGGGYFTQFDIDGLEVTVDALFEVFDVGIVILKSISFEMGDVTIGQI